MIEIKENGKVDARELHKLLGSKQHFADWIKSRIRNFDFINGKDFVTFHKVMKRSKTNEYELSINMAKELCLVENNNKGKQARKYFIEIQNKKQSGESFETKEIYAMIDLSKSMTLISIQNEVRKKHFEKYGDKYTWHKYRAEILGYSTKTIMSAMRKVNKKHKSITKSLVQLDANELIRTGVIDLFLALGKTKEYSINAGELCKKFALEMNLGTQIWDDTIPNPLGINKNNINLKKELYAKM